MPKLEDLLSKAHVTFCVDTNILVEFRPLGELPWHELAPSASHVRVIVPTKVGKEMDAHKQSAGRLRKRAADFAFLVARLERNDYLPLVLRERDPKVTVEFGALFKASDLDGDRFELEDPDNRIVAEAYRTAQEVQELVFISDDGLPMRLAHHSHLPAVRPPASWRRPEGTDERDQEIADLKRQLGPQPQLALGFPDGVGDDRRHVLGMPPATICPHCTNRITTAILATNPKVRRRVLEDRYPSSVRSATTFGLYIPRPLGEVTAEYLDDYEQDYHQFALEVQAWAQGLPIVLSRKGPVTHLRVEVSNGGDRAAEKVQLEVSLNGPFRFMALEDFQELSEDFLQPPEVPAPFGPISSLSHSTRGEPIRVDRFYVQDAPEEDGCSTMISWRCEELRQDGRFSLDVLVVAGQSNAQGAITARIRGANMAKGVSLTAPLRTGSDHPTVPFYRHLRSRLQFIPTRFRDALASELAIEERDCTCLEILG